MSEVGPSWESPLCLVNKEYPTFYSRSMNERQSELLPSGVQVWRTAAKRAWLPDYPTSADLLSGRRSACQSCSMLHLLIAPLLPLLSGQVITWRT